MDWSSQYDYPPYASRPAPRFVKAVNLNAQSAASTLKSSGADSKTFYAELLADKQSVELPIDDLPHGAKEVSYCAVCELAVEDENAHSASISHLLAKDRSPAETPTFYKLKETSKGYVMLKQAGWEGSGLGKDSQGRVAPVKDSAKSDKLGIGLKKIDKQRLEPLPPISYRQIVSRTEKERKERQAMLKYLNE